MRTTVTLDPDAEALIRQEMALKRRSFKVVINQAIRRGLQPLRDRSRKPYVVSTFRSGFRPGVDPARLNQLADELEARQYGKRAAEEGRG